MSTVIEILILIAILVEIIQSWFDRKNQDKLFKQMLEVLEDSNQELADIRDETVTEEEEQVLDGPTRKDGR